MHPRRGAPPPHARHALPTLARGARACTLSWRPGLLRGPGALSLQLHRKAILQVTIRQIPSSVPEKSPHLKKKR